MRWTRQRWVCEGAWGGLISVSEHLAREDGGAVSLSAFAKASVRHAALELGAMAAGMPGRSLGEVGEGVAVGEVVWS
jgi:hypothetical protein